MSNSSISSAVSPAELTKDDLRGLTPLIYGHINPYGVIQLNMDTRIPIEEIAAA